jgi:hypothetical protein
LKAIFLLRCRCKRLAIGWACWMKTHNARVMACSVVREDGAAELMVVRLIRYESRVHFRLSFQSGLSQF